ncbi:hypothetical protein [Neorhizobium sp. DT-125]|uniref:hypothetical protein n=1 Tax=Neorhizobium sp. DT-125 TaxID=3396163 RepID=UPI003F1C7455
MEGLLPAIQIILSGIYRTKLKKWAPFIQINATGRVPSVPAHARQVLLQMNDRDVQLSPRIPA